jgi:hypothetical protein
MESGRTPNQTRYAFLCSSKRADTRFGDTSLGLCDTRQARSSAEGIAQSTLASGRCDCQCLAYYTAYCRFHRPVRVAGDIPHTTQLPP